MARTISVINQQILDSITADTTLAPLLTSTSKRAIYRLYAFIVAVAINFLEQLMDIFTSNVETIASTVAFGTPAWLQMKMFAFQYSATNPQVIQFIDTVPQYPVVDTTLQIITACSVTTDTSNFVSVKVAKAKPLTALSSAELSAAQGYVNLIGAAGITYNVISLNPDKLYVNANVYYQGQYSAIIQANVSDAINNYLQTLSTVNFDGSLKISDLEGIIRNVAGVNDVVLLNVRGRADADAFTAGIDLVLGATIIQKQWKTISGYIGEETTTGKTFADSLNFIAE